ncbi:hypothetical protein [Benzoatithermus flavus]|uniref:Uncharacterized protein n=1 Tax=Benzoatithermus flavus TaxID=3108223 RepID=A0ABU8XWN1_9PROT
MAGLPASAREGLDPAKAPLALAVVDRGALLPEATASQAVTLDIPLPVVAGPDAMRAFACIVLLERSGSARAAPRRMVDHTIVRSTYRRGLERTPNPDYATLQRRVRELDRWDGVDVMPTGDPGIDLIGLAVGGILDVLGSAQRAKERAEAKAALAATPASLTEPVWEPYTYEVATVEAQRTGWLRAALLDRGEGRSWSLRREAQEARTFRVASHRSPKDRDLLENRGGTVVTPADVGLWESGGLRPAVSQVLTMLAETARAEPGSSRDTTALLGAWAAEELPGVAAAAGSDGSEPVRLGDAAGRHVGRSSLVEQVVAADGTRRYRLRRPASATELGWDEEAPEEEFSLEP